METLKEIKNDLKDFRKSVIRLSLAYLRLPNTLLQIDCEGLLDEIKYLNGYIDCMMAFNIPLLPEPDA